MQIQEAVGEVEEVKCTENVWWCSSKIAVLRVDAYRVSVYMDSLVLEIGCGHMGLDGKQAILL